MTQAHTLSAHLEAMSDAQLYGEYRSFGQTRILAYLTEHRTFDDVDPDTPAFTCDQGGFRGGRKYPPEWVQVPPRENIRGVDILYAYRSLEPFVAHVRGPMGSCEYEFRSEPEGAWHLARLFDGWPCGAMAYHDVWFDGETSPVYAEVEIVVDSDDRDSIIDQRDTDFYLPFALGNEVHRICSVHSAPIVVAWGVG